MIYSELLAELRKFAEPDFAGFQRRLIFTSREILGVRTPDLRKLAKFFKGNEENLLAFPNDYYEVVFIKLSAVATIPYEAFCEKVGECVALMDNWSLCDCFKAKCIAKHKDDFLAVLEKLFSDGREYFRRYPLVTLLSFYVEEKYLPAIVDFLKRADCEKYYYVHMAAAWLTAEVMTKFFDEGVRILQSGILPPATHNKAIQKAKESFRISDESKKMLEALKIKNK